MKTGTFIPPGLRFEENGLSEGLFHSFSNRRTDRGIQHAHHGAQYTAYTSLIANIEEFPLFFSLFQSLLRTLQMWLILWFKLLDNDGSCQ